MATLPDVIASYAQRDGSRYRLEAVSWDSMSKRERRWWLRHGQRIIDTMAAPYGPDVVGLLRDDTCYGVAATTAARQKTIQRIPIVFAGAGLRPQNS